MFSLFFFRDWILGHVSFQVLSGSCHTRRMTDGGQWRVECTVEESRNLLQRYVGVSKAHSSLLCAWGTSDPMELRPWRIK